MKKLLALSITLFLASTATAQGSAEAFGDEYTVDYYANSTYTEGNVTNHLENVEVGPGRAEFAAYIALDDNCTAIERSYEKNNHELVLKLDTYSTGKNCTSEQPAYQKYRFEVVSEKSFRLEVRHNGQETRTLQTPRYSPGENSSGPLNNLISFIAGLF